MITLKNIHNERFKVKNKDDLERMLKLFNIYIIDSETGNNISVGDDSVIINSDIRNDCVIGRSSIIIDSVIEAGASILPGSVIRNRVVSKRKENDIFQKGGYVDSKAVDLVTDDVKNKTDDMSTLKKSMIDKMKYIFSVFERDDSVIQYESTYSSLPKHKKQIDGIEDKITSDMRDTVGAIYSSSGDVISAFNRESKDEPWNVKFIDMIDLGIIKTNNKMSIAISDDGEYIYLSNGGVIYEINIDTTFERPITIDSSILSIRNIAVSKELDIKNISFVTLDDLHFIKIDSFSGRKIKNIKLNYDT